MIEINKDKNIGDVVFIVEGDKTEINLLDRIFRYIFDYRFISKASNGKIKNNLNKYNGNNNSCIVVVNTKGTNIGGILDVREDTEMSIEDYSDTLIYELSQEYNINISKNAVFYLFDRDPKLNKDVAKIKYTMNTLKNPYENDDNLEGGLFLISYPSCESFTVSNFEDKCYENDYFLGKDLKDYTVKQQYMFNKFSEETLKKATENLFEYLDLESIMFDNDKDLDDFSEVNIEILKAQEKYCKDNKKYRLVSLLIIAFLNLGLIEIKPSC